MDGQTGNRDMLEGKGSMLMVGYPRTIILSEGMACNRGASSVCIIALKIISNDPTL